MELRRGSIMMVLKVILKGILKVYYKDYSFTDEMSREILETLQ